MSTFDHNIEREVAHERRRIINILSSLPAPVQSANLREGYDYLFARADRRARITVMSKLGHTKEDKLSE